MKTKILYILVSSEQDIYLEQARISIASIRFHMCNAHIVLLTDDQTANTLTGFRSKISDEVDELIVANLSSKESPHVRSRILKTSARKYVTGNYLFIDTDTIILQPLDEIDDWSFDLGACRDSHSSFQQNPYSQMCISHCKKLGYNISEESEYFNSGVLFVKDSPIAHKFYEEWNKTWLEGSAKGVMMDQPSFALTNIKNNYIVTPMSDIWNCQILHGIKYLPAAKILHYLCTNSDKTGDIFVLRGRKIFDDIKATGNLPSNLNLIFENPFNGIPDLTHLHGGNIIYIFRSSSWYLLKRLYYTSLFKRSEQVASMFVSISGWIKSKFR